MASPWQQASLANLLQSIKLGELLNNFETNKILLEDCRKLSDEEMKHLGLDTIGDRVRFKDAVRKAMEESSGSTSAEQRASLFRPGRLSRLVNSKMKKPKTWPVSCMCVSDKDSNKIPSASLKSILLNAGLGLKRISFPANGDEICVKVTIISKFLKLKQAGGFELMKVMSNCRQLELINSKWDVETLKCIFGSQCKIYVRPIQESLCAEPMDVMVATSSVREVCIHCHKDFLITDLREHAKWCTLTVSLSDSEEERNQLPDIVQTNEVEMGEHIEEVLDISNTELQTPSQENALQENSDLRTEDFEEVYESIITFCSINNIDNPVDILREMQNRIVIGRNLELEDETTDIGEGKTNFIMIDRNNLLETAFEEIAAVENLRYTLEVQFYGEAAVDNGGPRKEFFWLLLLEIKESFFNPLRENLEVEKYEIIGKIFALSLLQNGPLPRILDPDLLNEVFVESQPRSNLLALRNGLDALGIVQITKEKTSLIHLFTPGNIKPLTLKMISNLLPPVFSEKGTNKQISESRMYRKFVKYMKEAASGRRGNVSLNKILMFTTSAEEEPVLGFKIHPSIHFIDTESALPTANTCISRLNLPRSSDLPEKVLFTMFDMAFCNAYFGLQ